jgi:hypothetical protein
MDRADVRRAFAQHVVSSMPNSSSQALPLDFINEFLDMKNIENDGRQCYIPLSKVSKWLQVPFKHLSRTLRGVRREWRTRSKSRREVIPLSEYLEGRDYVEIPTSRNAQGGRDFLLTKQCFDKICMKSNAKPQGDYVREYFSRINDLYTQFFERELQENIDRHGFEQVMNDMERPISVPYEDEPGLYAIEFDSDDDEKLVQIGHSLNGPAARFNFHKKRGKNHQLTRWEPHSFPKAVEVDVHMLLRPHRVPCVVDLNKKHGLYCSEETFFNRCDYHKAIDKSLQKKKELQHDFYAQASPFLSQR